ncbi:hypothetical protein [Pseudomonas sp. NPDC007930]
MNEPHEHEEEFEPGELPVINDPGNEDPGSELDDAPVPLVDEPQVPG